MHVGDMVARRIEPILRSRMDTFRAVALLGPRQSGKTTLVRRAVDDGVYYSLDDPDTLQAALEDPVGFVGLARGTRSEDHGGRPAGPRPTASSPLAD